MITYPAQVKFAIALEIVQIIVSLVFTGLLIFDKEVRISFGYFLYVMLSFLVGFIILSLQSLKGIKDMQIKSKAIESIKYNR